MSLSEGEPPLTEEMLTNARGRRETLEPRFRLSGLMILVLGIGLSLGVLSRAGYSTGSAWFDEWELLSRWLGMAQAPIGVAIVLALAIQIIHRAGSREPWGKQEWP